MKNSTHKPRIAFFGTPELCLPILEKLKKSELLPVVIITAPDKPVGRKQIMTPPAVKTWAQKEGIPILQPEKLDEEFKEEFEKYNPELSLVVAYGQIMPQWLIDIPTYSTLNLHYSLLPKYRGASPVEGAILSGDSKTGVCLQKMSFKLDAGEILACREIEIMADETAPELRQRLNEVGAELIIETISEWIAGDIALSVQDDTQATHTKKIKKSDGEVNIEKMSAEELYRFYRAYFGWPGIFFFDTDKNGKKRRIKITEATFENNQFVIEKVIPEGKRAMTYQEYQQGR